MFSRSRSLHVKIKLNTLILSLFLRRSESGIDIFYSERIRIPRDPYREESGNKLRIPQLPVQIDTSYR